MTVWGCQIVEQELLKKNPKNIKREDTVQWFALTLTDCCHLMTKRTQQTLFWFFQSFSLSNVLFMAVAFFGGGGSGGGRFGWTGKPFA